MATWTYKFSPIQISLTQHGKTTNNDGCAASLKLLQSGKAPELSLTFESFDVANLKFGLGNLYITPDTCSVLITKGPEGMLNFGLEAIAFVEFETKWKFLKEFVKDLDFDTVSNDIDSTTTDTTDTTEATVEDTGDTFHKDREKKSTAEYFGYYGELSQQQNMLTDFTRTSTYQYACFSNPSDFAGKVVCDVGCGTGILCFFAARAGARKVYGVDASDMADYAKILVKHNNMSDVITIIKGRVEDIELPEKVDLMISEPMGMALLNERMLDSYVCARKWLKPLGKMFPTKAMLYTCPFNDEMLFQELCNRSSFWDSKSFFGLDMTVLKPDSVEQTFRQPVVDAFSPECLIGTPTLTDFNFLTLEEPDLYEVVIKVSYTATMPATLHGLSFWFDVLFDGSQEKVFLSTSPMSPITHWYQTRCVFRKPVILSSGQTLDCVVKFTANLVQSYDIEIKSTCAGLKRDCTEDFKLKDPYFRAYANPTTYNAKSTPEQMEGFFGQTQSPDQHDGNN
eukprot:m.11796 g.11796  ORF g.11796 m.11796 type:complete len:510 (-) comp8982_c0_seq1:331-1860(-)